MNIEQSSAALKAVDGFLKSHGVRLGPNSTIELVELMVVTLATRPGQAKGDDLRKALQDAATSLETISRLAGRDKYMEVMYQVRGYALDRAKVAFAALSGTSSNEGKA